MRTIRETKLVDTYGDEHAYTLVQHGALEGRKLLSAVEKSILSLVSNGAELLGGGEFVGDVLDQQLTGKTIKQALVPVLDLLTGDDSFLIDLFKHTTRDGKKLSDRSEIDVAFQGNYGEMYEAQIWVIRENFIDPLVQWFSRQLKENQIGLSELLGGLLGKAGSISTFWKLIDLGVGNYKVVTEDMTYPETLEAYTAFGVIRGAEQAAQKEQEKTRKEQTKK